MFFNGPPYTENGPALGGHVFQRTKTISNSVEIIVGQIKTAPPLTAILTNALTKYSGAWKNITTDPPFGDHFATDRKHFELSKGIIRTTVSTKNQRNSMNEPSGGHVFQRTETIFELQRYIIKTTLLTRFNEDETINVTSIVYTSFELGQYVIGENGITTFHKNRTINEASSVYKVNIDDRQTLNDRQRSQKINMITQVS
ncbi:hypothetical protein DPMN_059157 [Dreissena polymorpha]|uniref:Uncharacterized protein n=1 Tax=Dreissena polymorpha TaxID=45954 RepID=A0A9D4HGB4_DREPO|nr:hypothetical protein DPMN_059157 [Dreissena polymorpha]